MLDFMRIYTTMLESIAKMTLEIDRKNSSRLLPSFSKSNLYILFIVDKNDLGRI